MRILAVDTAADQTAACLAENSDVLAAFKYLSPGKHLEVLPEAVESVLRAAGAKLSEVDVLAVDCGPGLYSGLRVGVAWANAVAYVLSRPIAALNSLEILAYAARPVEPRLVVPVLDARRGRVFAALYEALGEEFHLRWGPVSEAPEEVLKVLSELLKGQSDPKEVVVVGSGYLKYRELFEAFSHRGLYLPAQPPITVAARLAGRLVEKGTVLSAAGEVKPLYLREPDTRLGYVTRQGLLQNG